MRDCGDPQDTLDASVICADAGVYLCPRICGIKVEEDEDDYDEDEDVPSEDIPTENKKLSRKKLKGRYQMSIGMAEHLATGGCRTAVLSWKFNNPEHESCYSAGGCDHCYLQRRKDEDVDRLAVARHAKREDIELKIKIYDRPGEELKHKTKAQVRAQAQEDEKLS